MLLSDVDIFVQIQSLMKYVYSALKLRSDYKPGFHYVLHAFRFHDCLPGSLQFGATLMNQAAWLSSVPCVFEDTLLLHLKPNS